MRSLFYCVLLGLQLFFKIDIKQIGKGIFYYRIGFQYNRSVHFHDGPIPLGFFKVVRLNFYNSIKVVFGHEVLPFGYIGIQIDSHKGVFGV